MCVTDQVLFLGLVMYVKLVGNISDSSYKTYLNRHIQTRVNKQMH